MSFSSTFSLTSGIFKGARILKLFTFLSRRHQRKFIQYKASPKFKQIFSRPRKPHITAVPKTLTAAEEEAL
jgi:hypothetical protein